MAKKARPIVPLVCIVNVDEEHTRYARYVGRELTHAGTIDWDLPADEVEEFRKSPENWYAKG